MTKTFAYGFWDFERSTLRQLHCFVKNDTISVEARLQGANLSYAYLGETSLSDDDIPDDPEYVFKGFSTTNLAGADLRNANLCHTDLFHCNLEGANLRGADFTNACIKQEQLKLVLINRMTKLPKSFWSDPYKKS
ncbi:MAG: hypothetical protein DKINENOH_05513 [bacterium]|nr:hypothetical protein [bacterium]